WSDERARLGAATMEFFFCVSHASLWIRGEVTPAASTIASGRVMTSAHRSRCGLASFSECGYCAPAEDFGRYLQSCPPLTPKWKAVAGGVPYRVYKMVTDSKRRKGPNRLMKAIMEHPDALSADRKGIQ
ncbi:hypothetical protein FOZ63_013519, partial [Perkinsus olseni]